MQPFGELAQVLQELARRLDPSALFVVLTLQESGIYLPVPGNWLMVYAGVRSAEGLTLWYAAFAAGVMATLIGSSLLYAAARRGGRPLMARFGPTLGLTPVRQARIERGLARHGLLAVYVGRLIPGFRCGSSFVAGLFGVPFARFLLATGLSAATWWGFWLYVGWQFGPPLLAQLEASAGDILVVAALLSLLGLAALLLRAVWARSYSFLTRSAASAATRSRSTASTRSR